MCIKKEELPTVKTSIGFLFCMKSMMLSIEGRFIAKGFSHVDYIQKDFFQYKISDTPRDMSFFVWKRFPVVITFTRFLPCMNAMTFMKCDFLL